MLGQKGGQKNRQQRLEPELPLHTSPAALLDRLARTFDDLQANRVSPRVATAQAQMANSIMRVIDQVDLEERLAKLEQEQREIFESAKEPDE